MKKHLHVIQSIVPGSIAEEMELQPGDTVLAINGQDIEDVFDFQIVIIPHATKRQRFIIDVDKTDRTFGKLREGVLP